MVWHHSVFLISFSWFYCISLCIWWRGCSGRERGCYCKTPRGWGGRTVFFENEENVKGRSQWPRGLRLHLRPLACWDCGFECRRGHGFLSLVSVVCCQIEVSASGWLLVQRSPTDCGVSKWAWLGSHANGGPWPTKCFCVIWGRGGRIQKNTIKTYRAYLLCKKMRTITLSRSNPITPHPYGPVKELMVFLVTRSYEGRFWSNRRVCNK